ncbi:hypothetical protein N9C15_00500 [Schleiferiaceae bacterium]|nr:hypothetical protein [Schleiferiaceae bacterium]
MMKKILLFAGLLLSQSIFGQVTNFQKEFNSINEHLMLGLGSYAVANFAISGAGYFTSEDESSKRFHEMNVMWNTVNLGLAVPGYLKAKRGGKALTLEEMMKEQKKTEIIFFVNDVLDLGYIATGIWMRNEAANQTDRADMFKGYGNSLILQGSFLLAFDAYAYYLHRNHAKQLSMLNKVSVHTSGAGVALVIALD